MGFLDIGGLQDVEEKKIVPEGRYPLTIQSAAVKRNDNTGKENILCILSVQGVQNVSDIFHYISIPVQDDDADKRNFKLLMLKRFMVQFGIDFSGGINTEQFPGHMAECNVTVEEYQGRRSNKLVLDPLPA